MFNRLVSTMDDLTIQDLEGNEKQLLDFKHQSDMIISMFQNLVDGLKKKEIRDKNTSQEATQQTR